MSVPLSPGGNPLTSFVNMWQSPGDRRLKYRILRCAGLSTAKARRGRDFRLGTIERFYAAELKASGITLPPHQTREGEYGEAIL